MSAVDSPEEGTYGEWTYIQGLKLSFLLLAVLIVIRLIGPAAVSLGLAAQLGDNVFGVVLVLWLVGLLLQLLLAAFMATFLYISGHFAEPTLTSSVTASEAPYVAPSAAETTGATAIEPSLFLPPEFAGFFYFVPPVLLLVAGYEERGRVGDLFVAVRNLVAGYGVMALLTIVPVAWLFNNVVAPTVTDMLSTEAVTTTVRVEYPSLLLSHVLVGLAYPLLFGGFGAMLRDIGTRGVEQKTVGASRQNPNRETPQARRGDQGAGGRRRGTGEERPTQQQANRDGDRLE